VGKGERSAPRRAREEYLNATKGFMDMGGGPAALLRSIVTKNLLLFLALLLVAVVPLAATYDRDSRDYKIQTVAAKLEVFAERGATWLDVRGITTITRPEHRHTPAYQRLLADLNRIKREFDVDNAVVMRRGASGQYTYVAIDHDGFAIGEPVHIHTLFPDTYWATEETWQAGEMMYSRLFGGRVGEEEYAQFIQINTPLRLHGEVVAILMLNKFADPVAAAVRAKTVWVVGLSAGLLAVGLALFAVISFRMLRPLRMLTAAAGQVAAGNLGVPVPASRSADEIGRLNRAFRAMVEGLRQRDFIRETFGRYVSQEVVETVLGSPDGLRLGGDRREVTFLVSDLRGFTALAERLPPEQVLAILNRYLGRVVDVLARYRATVDEFQGDGILAFFGAPLAASDDPERAVACAIAMQHVLAELNGEQARQGLPGLQMGVGINTGEVIVGNIGSERRMKYGAVGAALNLAYRIESQTVGGQVLLGPTTYARVRDIVDVGAAFEVQFKGVAGSITLYEVAGLRGKHQFRVPQSATVPRQPVTPPLPVACHAIVGKRVDAAGIAGQITHASTEGVDVRLDRPVSLHTNVRIDLAEGEDAVIYAKVTAVHPAADGAASVSLTTTSASPEALRLLEGGRAAGVG
jgi:class 3 adenylate cyclase